MTLKDILSVIRMICVNLIVLLPALLVINIREFRRKRRKS